MEFITCYNIFNFTKINLDRVLKINYSYGQKGGSMKSLKQARMSKGVTKKAMAEHLGISGPTYDVYEDHPDRMRIETAKKAADFLGYKPEEIFFASNCN